MVIFITVGFYTIHLYKENKKYKSKEIKALCFQDLCIQINALMTKNYDLFREFGPNGGNLDSIDKLKDENDLLLWEKIKETDIWENNQKILNLINTNENLIYDKNKVLFNKMKNHIKAFELHVANKSFDYSQYQFPNDFAKFIKNECSNINLKKIQDIEQWITNETKNINIAQIYLHGSILNDYFNNIGDVDILILLNEQTTNKTAKIFQTLKIKFSKKFKKSLHLTVCSKNEEFQYEEFKNKLSNLKGF